MDPNMLQQLLAGVQQGQPQQDPQQMLKMNTVPYEVRRGDNLTKIARDNDTDVQTLIRINPEIKNPDRIFPGQEIRLPIPREIMNMQQRVGVSEPDPSRYSHPAFNPDEDEIMRQGLMGVGAGALPLAAMVAPSGVPSALGALARGAPNMLNRAGAVEWPMSKGAAHFPGAAKTFSNVRPLEGGLGASRAATQAMLGRRAQLPNIGPRGMSRVPFNSTRPMNLDGPPSPGGLTLEQILASMR